MKSDNKHEVVLFLPNTRWFGKRPWLLISHSALILTSIFKDEVDFYILDANIEDLSEEECIARIKELDPKIFLFSGISLEYSLQYHKSAELAKRVNKKCITIFGGVYPTLMPEEAMADCNIDYVFLGPGEFHAPEFLQLLLSKQYDKAKNLPGVGFRDELGKVMINATSKLTYDMKSAPEPDYSLIDVETYLANQGEDYNISFEGLTAVLLTSYGCKYNCVFCAARTIRGKGTVYRSAEKVLEEIDWLVCNHGVKHLSFLDELFLGERERAIKIMNAFIDRDYKLTWKMPNVSAWHLDNELLELMKRAGCIMITVSVESGSSRVLKKIIHKPGKLKIYPPIVKKCRELGIVIASNFVIGLPGETWSEIRQTFQFAEEMNFDMCSFHIATPYPGTDLYRIAQEQQLLPDDFNFFDPKYFGTSQGFITTNEFTPFELMVLRAFEWDRINFKTPDKVLKIAQLMNMTIDELNEHRKETRQKIGVHHY